MLGLNILKREIVQTVSCFGLALFRLTRCCQSDTGKKGSHMGESGIIPVPENVFYFNG